MNFPKGNKHCGMRTGLYISLLSATSVRHRRATICTSALKFQNRISYQQICAYQCKFIKKSRPLRHAIETHAVWRAQMAIYSEIITQYRYMLRETIFACSPPFRQDNDSTVTIIYCPLLLPLDTTSSFGMHTTTYIERNRLISTHIKYTTDILWIRSENTHTTIISSMANSPRTRIITRRSLFVRFRAHD